MATKRRPHGASEQEERARRPDWRYSEDSERATQEGEESGNELLRELERGLEKDDRK